MQVPRIFLSYSKTDKIQATQLYNELTKAGLNVWWDELLNPGEDWEQRITA